nr:hypothetical protein CFP56_40290 [Quercus suber]
MQSGDEEEFECVPHEILKEAPQPNTQAMGSKPFLQIHTPSKPYSPQSNPTGFHQIDFTVPISKPCTDSLKHFVRRSRSAIQAALRLRSKSERALVKELASLRASSRLHSDSANTNGTMHGDFDEHKIRDLKNHASSPGIKGVASLWKSIKNFLGQRRSEEGFASVSFDSSSSLWRRLGQR